ncbi:hypothetical protein B0H14DRAFT_1329438 [Mycena olivaceomarginata]|nr:hypothetical protein B0H14DRAFT_1329438 [Mycena olivaceomarginata]
MRSSSMDQTALQAAVSRRRCLSSPRFLGVLVFLSLAPTARTTRPDKRTKSRNRPRAEGAGVRRVQSPSSVQRRASLDSSIHTSIHPSILSADARVLDGFLSSQRFIVRPVMSSAPIRTSIPLLLQPLRQLVRARGGESGLYAAAIWSGPKPFLTGRIEPALDASGCSPLHFWERRVVPFCTTFPGMCIPAPRATPLLPP